mgnify:CR=1 FL=1
MRNEIKKKHGKPISNNWNNTVITPGTTFMENLHNHMDNHFRKRKSKIKMEAIKDLLFRMADDELIIGHRNSEWTGIGPILEEDLAFSSMAQDKLGHALANYSLLEKEYGEKNPDELAFARDAKSFRCCQLVEYPIGEYDFTLVRHFLFDTAEFLRYDLLQHSSFALLAAYSKKIKGELKYHLLHADTWIIKLGNATEESHARMQSSLNEI